MAEFLVQVVAALALQHVLGLVLHLSVLREDALFDVLKQWRHDARKTFMHRTLCITTYTDLMKEHLYN